MLYLTDDYYKYENQIINMLDEYSSLEKMIPYSIRRIDYKDFKEYVLSFKEEKDGIEGLVPATTYFFYDDDLDIIIGAVNIRHYLNDHLLNSGGHIGDGIRPSMRNKGYGTKMIKKALEKCEELNIFKVLMVCEKTNIASAKTIIKNNGVLENEIVDHKGLVLQRYWICL